MPTTILVADDEKNILELCRLYLVKEGFTVETAIDGQEVLDKVRRSRPDLVVLDIMMPRIDGLEVCRRLRKDTSIPIIMLTARGDDVDKVVGLELGADDYVTKPFHMEEVLARIRALLRRAAGHATSDLVCGSVRLDTKAGRVVVDGAPIKLTSHEYRLLAYMMHHTGRVISRTELVEHLYDQDFDRDSNTIEVFMGRLRKKLGVDMIQTVRGLGYLLEPPAPGDAR